MQFRNIAMTIWYKWMLTNGDDEQLVKESYNENLNKWQIPKTIMQSNDQPGHKATTTTN